MYRRLADVLPLFIDRVPREQYADDARPLYPCILVTLQSDPVNVTGVQGESVMVRSIWLVRVLGYGAVQDIAPHFQAVHDRIHRQLNQVVNETLILGTYQEHPHFDPPTTDSDDVSMQDIGLGGVYRCYTARAP